MSRSRKIIITDDGTSTIYMDEYEQAMHTVSGAYEESVLKHVIPSKILDKKYSNLNILDIGFGMGYNLLALIKEFEDSKSDKSLEIVSLEKENDFTDLLNTVKFNDERDKIYENVKKAYIEGEARFKNIHIIVKFGDARNSIREMQSNTFDAVFQDAFSPFYNPELWSLDFFHEVSRIIKHDGILTTYSSAPQIRMALHMAGFHLDKGPSVGKKREGTIASLSYLNEETEKIIIDELINNKKSEPYTDPDLKSERKTILESRLERIKKKK